MKEKGHPIITQLLRDFAGAEAPDDATVVCRFAEKRARDVPLFVAALPIFSKAYYTTKPFDQSTLEVPLGCGPYKVGRFEAPRYIEYERVKDWWGAGLPVSRGQYNFDIVRFEFYRDRDVAFEGFTAKSYLFREEFTSRIWATRYDFPALRDGKVKRDILPDDTPSGAQGWFINTRRPQFKDPRLREALICAFDFEWTNKTIMYDSYKRTQSVFQNSDMMAVGPPSAEELALLEPFRGKVPEEVFSEPYLPPVSDGSGADRTLLRKAVQLLREGGYTVRDEVDPAHAPGVFERVLMAIGLKAEVTKKVLRDAQGKPVTIEFLIEEASSSRITCRSSRISQYWESKRRCASSRGRRCKSVATISILISPFSVSVFPPRLEIRCDPISLQRRQGSPARRILPALRTPRSMP